MFSFTETRSEGAGLDLTYHLTPWDRPIFQANTAAISLIRLKSGADAAPDFEAFRTWCARNDVKLVSCRLAQTQLVECAFLEAQGFRFIELNYRPTIKGLARFCDDADISICPATVSDEAEISFIAAHIFETGRLQVDPQGGPEIGNRRYAAWAANAFHTAHQHVLKCLMGGRITAFLVVERPTATSRFWSMAGLAPGLAGRGLGRRIWQAWLAFHHREGIDEVSTSISSHNIAVHNLYVSLGFRFPAPTITLHWCPSGPVSLAAP